MFPFISKNLIGIDTGSYSTKVVWLKGGLHPSGGRGSYRLKSASYTRGEYPRLGDYHSASDGSAGFLHSIAMSQRLSGKKAATVLYGPSLTVRHVYLPPMPDKDLKEAVKWEIRKESAIPPDELVCDYVVSPPDARASGGNLSIIAFAIKRGTVETLMSEFKSAGVDIRVVETVPTALLSSFDANNVWEEGVNYAFVDIGLSASTLAIFKNGRLSFVREMAFGGAEITNALAADMGKTGEECESIKASCSLDARERGTTQGNGIAARHVERLCTDIHRSFEYYQAQYRGGQVAKLYLCGGTARIKGIDGFVSETLGIPAFVDDPLRNTRSASGPDKDRFKDITACMSVAFGAAVRMASDG